MNQSQNAQAQTRQAQTRQARHLLDFQPEVAAALAEGRPVVALESTIISHGMPYPQNVEMARGVEQIVRDNGAVPATIAVLGGRLKVGLSADELELLATDKGVQKISTRDLPVAVALRQHGATTVASTMRIAALAGIRVFATGGTGGVHRGAGETMDISADLLELARTDVCVVSAGVKSILDIGLTLEVLETQGVPAITLGADEFPRLLLAPQRLQVAADGADPRRGGPRAEGQVGPGADGRRPARQPGARDRRDSRRGNGNPHHAGAGRHGRARADGQGHHALPAGPHRGTDRGAAVWRRTSPWYVTTRRRRRRWRRSTRGWGRRRQAGRGHRRGEAIHAADCLLAASARPFHLLS